MLNWYEHQCKKVENNEIYQTLYSPMYELQTICSILKTLKWLNLFIINHLKV